jgi:hypothetical protein
MVDIGHILAFKATKAIFCGIPSIKTVEPIICWFPNKWPKFARLLLILSQLSQTEVPWPPLRANQSD